MEQKPTLTSDEMKAALASETQKRVEAAAAEIKATCERHKVQIVPKCELTQGSVTMSLQILPIE